MAITIPFSFSPTTKALSAQVNSNFTAIGSVAANTTGDTLTGPFNTQNLIPTVNNSYDLGSSSFKFRNLFLAGTPTFASTVVLNGLTYTWPASQTALYFLQTDGSGNLSWQPATSVIEAQVFS